MQFQYDVATMLQECFDALRAPGWDPEHWDKHLQFVDDLSRSDTAAESIKALAQRIGDRMRRAQRSFLDGSALVPGDPLHNELVRTLSDLEVQQFIYHGTVFGRLKSIHAEGLWPAKLPVWKHTQDIRDYCASGVFFTTIWRSAANFADAAHLHSRGPRNGLSRMPVVIRISALGLPIEDDPRASVSGCVMVRGSVSVTDGEVFIPPLKGLSRWQRIDAALAARPRATSS